MTHVLLPYYGIQRGFVITMEQQHPIAYDRAYKSALGVV